MRPGPGSVKMGWMPAWSDIFAWAAFAAASLVPIVGWGYLFSYVGGESLSARRFAGGLVAGCLSAAVIFALDKIFSGEGLAAFHPYAAPETGEGFPWRFALGLGGAGAAIMSLAALAAAAVVKDPLPGLALAAKAVPAVLLAALVLALARLGLENAPAWPLASPFSARGVAYASLGLALAYYLAVAAVEEICKLGHAAPSFPAAKDGRDVVLTALFVALGFALLENALYVRGQWSAGHNPFGTWAFRSVFSTLLHAGAAAVAAWWLARDARWSRLVPNAAVGLALAAGLHAFFNAGVAAGWAWVPLAYLAAGYAIGGRALYREDTPDARNGYPAGPDRGEPA